MKIFLKRLLYFIPIPLLIISVNYFEDPANLFNDKYVLGIANYLAQGYNVTNVRDCDERLLQKYFIEKMNECPTEIVLGPSTVQLINNSYSIEKHFINNGVGYASLEDYLAIFYLYEKKGCKIKKVLLGLAPCLLNDNNDLNRWKVLGNEYSIFLNKILKNTVVINTEFRLHQYVKFKELVSFSYFKTSLSFYFKKKVGKKYKPTKISVNEGFTRLKDGSVCYEALRRNASMDEVEKKAKRDLMDANPIYTLGNFTHLSEHYKLIFSNFVEYLQKQNVEVEFFLSPFHPIMYEYFKKNNYYHIVFKTENYFKDYASSRKIKVFGSYDPVKYNFDNSYFFDGWHPNEKAIEKMLKSDNK